MFWDLLQLLLLLRSREKERKSFIIYNYNYKVTPSKASRRLESKNFDAEMSSPIPFRRLVLMQNSLAKCETGLGSNGLN